MRWVRLVIRPRCSLDPVVQVMRAARVCPYRTRRFVLTRIPVFGSFHHFLRNRLRAPIIKQNRFRARVEPGQTPFHRRGDSGDHSREDQNRRKTFHALESPLADSRVQLDSHRQAEVITSPCLLLCSARAPNASPPGTYCVVSAHALTAIRHRMPKAAS